MGGPTPSLPEEDPGQPRAPMLVASPADGVSVVDLDWRSVAWAMGAVVALVAATGLVRSASRAITVLAIGTLLALALDPLVSRVQRHLRGHRTAAVAVVMAGFLVVLLAAVALLAPPAIRQGRDLGRDVDRVVAQINDLPVVGDDLRKAGTARAIEGWIERLPDRLEGEDTPLGPAAARLADALVVFGFTVLVIISLLLDGPRLVQLAHRLVPNGRRKQAARVGRLAYDTVGKYVAGSLMVAVIAGLATLVAGLVLGVPLAPLIAVWVALFDLVPQIGGAAGGIPFVLLGLTKGAGTAVACAIFFVLYLQFENHVLGPLIVGRAVKLSPPATMTAALVGVSAGGVVGALMAVPLVAAAKVVYLELRPGPPPDPAEEPAPAAERREADPAEPPEDERREADSAEPPALAPSPPSAEAMITGGIEIITGFESTFLPAFDVDITETTGHSARWKEDLDLVRDCGVTRLRYSIRWHRIEPEKGCFEWAMTDEVLGYMQDQGMRPIVDLLHHTSYPRWLTGGFDDERFPTAYLRYLEAFARRYPEVDSYTLFNEPFTTFLFSGFLGKWPPHLEGLRGFVRLVTNVFPAVAEGSRMYRDLLPDARHVYVDTAERHSAANRRARKFAALVNDRRFFLLDLFLGQQLDPSRPFLREMAKAGTPLDALLAMEPGHVDVVGLDYYAHNQWEWYAPDRGTQQSSQPGTLAALFVEYWERYRRPCILGETNIRGFASDRATWLKYTLEQCELAREAGVPVEGYCWYPFVDSTDWDSLLSRADRHIDPVGVYWLDERLERRKSSISASFSRAAAGEPASALPAYVLQPPVSGWLRGWTPQMAHWDWQPPPAAEVRPPVRDV